MPVEIRKTELEHVHKHYGKFKKPGLFDAVLYAKSTGAKPVQIGWRPADPDDPHHKTLHPLSGAPQQICEIVVKESSDLERTLTAPTPHTPEAEDFDDDDGL